MFIGTPSYIFSQPASYYKEYGTGSVELSIFGLDTVHDGGNILFGSYENTNGGNGIIIKTDSLGNELWRKQNAYFTSFDSTNLYYCLKESIDKGFILCGYIRILDSVNSFNNQYLITKIDSLGNTMWEKIFGDYAQETFQSIVINEDSTFFVSGLHTSTFPNQLSLHKFDQSGNILWDSLYNFSPNGIYNSLLKRFSDTLVFALTLRDSMSLIVHSGVFECDTTGSFIDSVFLSASVTSMPLDFTKTDQGKYGIVEQRGYGGTQSNIILLDSTLNVLSVSGFPSLLIGRIDKDLNIFSCRFDSLTAMISTSMVNQFSDTVWQNLSNEPYLYPNYIINKNGCAIVCGRKDQGNTTTSKGFLFKVCDSILINQLIEISQTKDEQMIVVYETDQKKIFLNDELFLNDGCISISIYDLSGKLIDDILDINSRIIYLKNEDYNSGLYNVVLRKNNFYISSKKIIFN